MNNKQDLKEEAEKQNMRVFKAIVLNDYPEKHYATWVKEKKKTIETRMKSTKYRGDLVICCGSSSVTGNAGKALCVVELYDVRDMQDSDSEAACIENKPKRKAWLLRNWRYFSRDFNFSKRKVQGSFQWLFRIIIPEDVKILSMKSKKSGKDDGEKEAIQCTHDPNTCKLWFCGWPDTCDEKSPDVAPVASYHAVEFAGYWQIKTEPFYDAGKNILDAEDVGEEQAEKNAELITKLLNKYQCRKLNKLKS